jgi:hypothetical protein
MYRSLNSKQRDVVTIILLMANHKEKQWEHKGEIYRAKPGQLVTSLESIKQNCAKDVSIQNIRTALLKLEKWGFLTNKSTNKNRLITIVNWEVYQPKEKNQQTDQHPTNKQLTTNKNEENVKKNNIDQSSARSSNSYSIDFEEFWDIYPRKIGKLKAFSCWKARIKKASKDDLIKAVQNYARYCKMMGIETNYIKHPSTFLGKNLDYEDWIEYKLEQPKNNVVSFESKRDRAKQDSTERQIAINRWTSATGRGPDENFLKWFEEGAKQNELHRYIH